MKEEKRIDEPRIELTDTPSPRVPLESNVYAGSYYDWGLVRLPITADDRLFLSRMSMRILAVRRDMEFPSRMTVDVDDVGEVDLAVTREGFLVRADQAELKTLQRLVRYLEASYGVAVAPYDVIRRVGGLSDKVVCMIRLIPCGPPAGGDKAKVASPIRRYFQLVSDEFLMSCMNVHRAVSVSEFTEESLDLAAELVSAVCDSSQSKARSRPKRTPVVPKVLLCSVADMERRIEREPNRNSNSNGGSLPTLQHLCEEKHLIVPGKEALRRVAALSKRLPNFSAVIDYIGHKLEAQRLCKNPMRLPPLLLLGDAGVGKSHFCRTLTEALGMPFECLPLAGTSQELHITGLSKNWGSAGPSRLAEIMGKVPMANPMVMVDEIDKASDIKLHNALLQIFEPETAARWVDQYVEVPIDLSRVMFVATANDLASLSPLLVSRFEVFEIKKPSDEQLVAVLNSIYFDELRQFGHSGIFHPDLPVEVCSQLIQSAMTPREARRVLLNAMEFAVIRTHRQKGSLRRGRVTVQLEDLPLSRSRETSCRIGFI